MLVHADSFFGSCKQLGIGPVSVTSLMLGAGLSRLVPGSEHITDPNHPENPKVRNMRVLIKL